PDEAADPVGPASTSQFTHSVPVMQLPVSAVPVGPQSGDGLLSATALAALSSGFHSGAAADPGDVRTEPS
ncbi:MAG: hypothetical protein ABJA16_09210, partial [Nakamurella sp.]